MAPLASKVLTKEQQVAVEASWESVKALGNEQVGVLLFREIFRLAPEALQLFSFQGEAELYESVALRFHGAKVVTAVGTAVAQLGNVAQLTTSLRALSMRHAFMGLGEMHFEAVGSALLSTLRTALGSAFTPELEAAWEGVYGFMQQTMLLEITDMRLKVDSIMKGDGKAAPEVTVGTPTTASDGGSESPGGATACDSPLSIGGGSREVEPACDGEIVEGNIRLSTPLWATRMTVPEKQEAKEVDERDRDTPDGWVKRRPEMVRLTGRHPFNSEPPLRRLQEAGWVTPASLHVVRNHGAVPKLTWETHRLKLSGGPRGDCELSMHDLASGKVGPVVSIPVTFICAGNRRKEQNMTKKTIGFNWGAAAVGNSVWTGVRLCDVLAYLGITHASEKHQYVHFAGPMGELPQGADGSYGTSIAIGWALDRERDVLLAFKQNGELLTPDHGAPLRTLLPGCIGGRMIKWLTTLSISDQPSESHYHFFDNRVLPPHVDAELATAEGWWFKPEYVINHMNINSAMFEPRHNAFFPLGGSSAYPTVKVSGYAYVGGGLKIIRAEISLDGGRSWEIADLTRPEDEIAAARGTDKHWCWAWWETEVEASRLRDCREICCRAVDSNQNMQPMHLTWNVMGMMNNCLFRIKLHPWTDAAGTPGVWFEHPTMPGNEPGGWMTEDAGKYNPKLASLALPGNRGTAPHRPVAAVWSQGNITDTVAARDAGADTRASGSGAGLPTAAGRLVTLRPEWLAEGITMEEVAKHDTEQSAWIVVKGRVYDCTPYLQDHPGGASSILLLAGQDATEDFEAVHSKKAWLQLEDYFIGPLWGAAAPAPEEGPEGPEEGPEGPEEGPEGLEEGPEGLEEEEEVAAMAAIAQAAAPAPAVITGFLQNKAQALPLVDKINLSPDTRIFRFGLPTPNTRLGLPTGMHMLLTAKVDGETVMRPYTPMTDDTTLGFVDLLVKVYGAGVHPKFPEGGKMSQHLESMKIGDTIDVKGPLGEFVYRSMGAFSWKGKARQCRRISLVAGGTGLTPCYQVLTAVLRDPHDATEVRLLYANRTPEDILLRQELDALAAAHPGRFKLWYTVDLTNWSYDVSFLTQAMLEAQLFPAADNTISLMCGPEPMTRSAAEKLQQLGYEQDNVLVA